MHNKPENIKTEAQNNKQSEPYDIQPGKHIPPSASSKNKSDEVMERYLHQIKEIFNIKNILSYDPGRKDVVRYFRLNRLAYRFLYSREGYMHLGISYNGKHSPSNLVEGLHIIERYMRSNKAERVLELAHGMGSNLAYLASRWPEVQFTGIDLVNKPLHRYKRYGNISFLDGDYHSLDLVKDRSQDIVFIVEALCYSQSKERVVVEVYQKLKPGGYLIIFDAYSRRGEHLLSEEEKVVKKLVERGMVVPCFEELDKMQEYFSKSGFTLIEEKDLSLQVLPSIKKLNRLAHHFFKSPRRAKMIKAIFPSTFVWNSVSGYLILVSIENDISCYYLHVLQKPF